MKNPCPLCNERKAQRRCFRHNDAVICSVCCAQTRDASCAGCSYYSASQQYQAERSQRPVLKALPEGHFIAEMNPAIDDAVDAAMELCEQGNMDAARQRMSSLVREHPRNHSVCFGMGVLHVLNKEHEEAISWFDKAIAIYPYFVEAHFNRAMAYKEQLKLAQAVYSFRKVLALGDPSDVSTQQAQSFIDTMTETILRYNDVDLDTYLESQILFDGACTRMEQGDWSGALMGFQASAAKNERNPSTHGNLGLCLASLGLKAQSLLALDRALELDPHYEPARINRAVVENMEEGTPLLHAEIKTVEFGGSRSLAKSQGK